MFTVFTPANIVPRPIIGIAACQIIESSRLHYKFHVGRWACYAHLCAENGAANPRMSFDTEKNESASGLTEWLNRGLSFWPGGSHVYSMPVVHAAYRGWAVGEVIEHERKGKCNPVSVPESGTNLHVVAD